MSPYGVPRVLWLLTAIGLLSALLGDGIWDVVSWITLAVPVLVIGTRVFRRRETSR